MQQNFREKTGAVHDNINQTSRSIKLGLWCEAVGLFKGVKGINNDDVAIILEVPKELEMTVPKTKEMEERLQNIQPNTKIGILRTDNGFIIRMLTAEHGGKSWVIGVCK